MATLKLVSRDSWGATKTSGVSTNISPQYGGVAIHYVGGSGKLIGIPHSKCTAVVREIQRLHMEDNDWADIAYSFIVCCHGSSFVGRGLGKRTAANGTNEGNQNYYAICGLINSGETPTDEMLDAIALTAAYCRSKGGAAKKVVGHRNLKSTDCPGPLYRFVQSGRFSPKPADNNAYPGKVVKKGDSGPIVGKIQKRLNEKGASPRLVEDEDFGSLTEKEVKDFQKKEKLNVTGQVNSETWDELF